MRFRNLLLTLVIIGAGIYFYFYSPIFVGACGRPIEYSIGTLDQQFGISPAEFQKDALAAEAVWEKAAGKELFTYTPGAKFKINLIYDQRQMTIDQKQKTEFGLTQAEDVFKSLDGQFLDMQDEVEKSAAAHEARVAQFQQESAQYNADVKYWNGRGGAPKEEYDRLQEEQSKLNTEVASLNQEAAGINSQRDGLNALLQKRNDAANKYNALAAAYNNKYGGGLEFEQGEYNGTAIDIYEFKTEKDLSTTLAHEMGHALGMNHVENSRSIMYYLSNDRQSLTPTTEDLAELNRACKLK